MKHIYRLVAKQVSPYFFNQGEREIYDNFINKYHALVTGNEEKERITFHLGSEAPLEKKSLEQELSGISGLEVVGLYEGE